MQVAFYKGQTRFFNKAVCWWLNGPYSHAELILETDHNGISACASSSFMDGGVRLKYMRLNPANWDIFEIDGDIGAAWTWLRLHDEMLYDTFGLIGTVWRRSEGDPNKMWCTESIAAMLGYDEPWRFDPMVFAVVIKERHERRLNPSRT